MSDQQNSEEIKLANLRDELEENKTKIQNLEKKISPLKEEFNLCTTMVFFSNIL